MAFAFLLGLPMFMLPIFMLPIFMFPRVLAFPLAVFATPLLVLAGVVATFALTFAFELLAVVHPAHTTVVVSKNRRVIVRFIEVPPLRIRYNSDQISKRTTHRSRQLTYDGNYIVDALLVTQVNSDDLVAAFNQPYTYG